MTKTNSITCSGNFNSICFRDSKAAKESAQVQEQMMEDQFNASFESVKKDDDQVSISASY